MAATDEKLKALEDEVKEKLQALKENSENRDLQYLGWLEEVMTEFKTVYFLITETSFTNNYQKERCVEILIGQNEHEMDPEVWRVDMTITVKNALIPMMRELIHDEKLDISKKEAIKMLEYVMDNGEEVLGGEYPKKYPNRTVRICVQDNNLDLRIGCEELKSGKYNSIIEIMMDKVNPITRTKRAN